MDQLSSKPRFCFGPFEFDPRTGELRERDRVTLLQQQPAEILLALLERQGDLVTREELVRRLWPSGTFVDFDRSLNKAVNKLREALRDSAEEPQFIETLPRRGYRFITPGRVAVLGAPDSSSVAKANSASGVAWKTEQHGHRRTFALLVASAALIAGVAGYRLRRPGHDKEPQGLQLSRLTANRRTEGVAISPDGRYVVYAAQEGGRRGLWIRQVLAPSSDVEIVSAEPMEFAGLTFSPDGNYVYFVRGGVDRAVGHSLFVTPVLGGPAKLLLTGIDSPVSFSPDGHQIAYTRGTPDEHGLELRTADPGGRDSRVLAVLRDAVPFHQAGPAWSPDGRTIAVSVMLSRENQPWALEAVSTTNGTVHEIHSSLYKIGRPLWLPTGDRILAALDDQDNHGQLYLIAFPSGKPRRLTNDLADYDDDRIDLTRDGKEAAIVAWDQSGNVWQAPAAEPARAQQLESSGVALLSIAARRDGKILATDLNNRLWIMNPDGSQRALFTDFHPARDPVVCGQSVIFLHSTIQWDLQGLMRAGADGTNVRQMVGEHVGAAACPADGKFVFYAAEDSPQKIRKIPVEGGDPVDVAVIPGDRIETRFALSPDGTRLAYLYRELGNPAGVGEKLAVMPANGGRPVDLFRMRGEPSTLRWSPDGTALQYTICVFCAGNASNVWEQRLDGGEPKQLTNFTSGQIFDFTWSADGKQLLLLRGDLNGDVVLVSNFR